MIFNPSHPLSMTLPRGKKFSLPLWIVCSVPLVVGAVFAFPLAFVAKTNLVVGLLLMPLVFRYNGHSRFNIMYALFAVFFTVITFVYHVRIFYFFALGFFTLFILEYLSGQIDRLVLFLLAFMSPFFQTVTAILGFPIRLQLSQWAGSILNTVGYPVQVEGNMMVVDGMSFAVDDACMGLNMLVYGMLMGVFLLAWHKRKLKRELSLRKGMAFFSVIIVLDLVNNLLRIVLLVLFKITPEHPLHETVGLICFALYVLLPSYFISRAWIQEWGTLPLPTIKPREVRASTINSFLLVSIALMVAGIHLSRYRSNTTISHSAATLPGYERTILDNGVTKLTNGQALVYVKPIPEFFTGEHTPLLCWRGSGYKFESITEEKLNGISVYTGKLVKDEKSLYTTWWYSNGSIETIDQIDWRFRTLKGEDRFSLINVTANSREELKQVFAYIHANNMTLNIE